MKKLINILKNKEIMGRIVFTIMILFIFRLGAQVTVPGVSIPETSQLSTYLSGNNPLSLMNLLGGGELTKKLTVQAKAFSKSAEAAINNAGGKIEVM